MPNQSENDIKQVLSFLRQISIMMWAKRYDHAHYIAQQARDILNQLPDNNHVSVDGLNAKVHLLNSQLKGIDAVYVENVGMFHYSVSEREDMVELRAYCFDDADVSSTRYIEAFQNQEGVLLSPDPQNVDEKYPIVFRLFSHQYFAEVCVFSVDSVQVHIMSATSEYTVLIDDFIRRLNSTRK